MRWGLVLGLACCKGEPKHVPIPHMEVDQEGYDFLRECMVNPRLEASPVQDTNVTNAANRFKFCQFLLITMQQNARLRDEKS